MEKDTHSQFTSQTDLTLNSAIKPKKRMTWNHCCILCKKRNKDGIVLHSFPTDQKALDIWLSRCGITTFRGYEKICSDHFSQVQYIPHRKFFSLKIPWSSPD